MNKPTPSLFGDLEDKPADEAASSPPVPDPPAPQHPTPNTQHLTPGPQPTIESAPSRSQLGSAGRVSVSQSETRNSKLEIDNLSPAASPDEALARARDLLAGVDPEIPSLLPAALLFPLEDDPFCRSAVDWEGIWFGTRESTLRVYYNARVCFRRELEKALKGGQSDLKPWTRWVFGSPRPDANEPIHGLPHERRQVLGWTYPGDAGDLSAYRDE